jgi:hypothetical protein
VPPGVEIGLHDVADEITPRLPAAAVTCGHALPFGPIELVPAICQFRPVAPSRPPNERVTSSPAAMLRGRARWEPS